MTDLTRMLLSSQSFSSFLDNLSSNPSSIPAPPVQVKPEPQQQQDQRQMPKDVNPYAQQGQQQIGMAMIPEQNIDFSMLALDNNTFNFQPQVFLVDTLDVPAAIDTAALSGKASNFVAESFETESKNEVPSIERPIEQEEAVEEAAAPVDEEFENDEEFALFHTTPSATTTAKPTEVDTESFSQVDIFWRY